MKKQSADTQSQARVCYESLESFVRAKAQQFIQEVLEEEVAAVLGRERYERKVQARVDESGGYRNGYGKPRKFAMLNGTVEVQRPRVRGLDERFVSRVLPLFKRQSRELRDHLPELYLHGLSSGDFELAMRGLLGDAAPLSPSSMHRLKAKWQLEFDEWKKRDLSGLEVVYWWADGLYVKAGIEDRKSALLTIVAALTSGEKIVLAIDSGERESKDSWLEVLRDLKKRRLKFPKLTVADGHLGIWAALGEINPSGHEQRCWNHKIVNVLDKLPRKEQAEAAELLKAIPYADTKTECEKRRDQFILRYRKSQPKAAECLLRDWDRMVTFYSYPKEHWIHLRTTNIVESPFNSVRLRTDASRRYKKVENAKAMIWKLLSVAEKSWRKLNAPELLPGVLAGKKYVDGAKEEVNKINRKLPERASA